MNTSNTNCIESFNLIVHVFPIKKDELSYKVPFSVQTTSTSSSDIGISSLPLFLADRWSFSMTERFDAGGYILSVDIEEVTIESQTNKDRSGYNKKVSLRLDSTDHSYFSRQQLVEFERSVCDFIVIFDDGTYGLIRTPENGADVSVVDDFENKKIDISVHNINGVQVLS